MGNLFSDLKKACPCLFPYKPNIPTKPRISNRPKPDQPTDPDNADFLVIKGWNFEIKKNGSAHHTSEYYLMQDHDKKTEETNTGGTTTGRRKPKPSLDPPAPTLVVRRGQPFFLTLNTNKPYDADAHQISLLFFVVGASANFGNKTQIGVKLGAEDSPDGWLTKIHEQNETTITIEIKSSADSIVGEWKLEIDANTNGKLHSFEAPQNFYLLFNPWCEDDQVYLDGDDEIREYVQLDSGLIWRGTHNRLRPCPWNFGQYEKNVLECVLYVLSNACKLIPAHRADPVKVVRAISAGVNSPDDNGILVGNWSSKYTGGTAPTHWRGSVNIMQQYYKKKNPVKFGQCWVFSGVVTTVCRALGIPCRPVTNFSSAHDTHNSLTIDYFFGDDGKVIEDLNADSVWNFHVWNEVWFARPDLGPDYSGWQVIDATPQEESDGQYRCGPTSLTAIYRGEILYPYDAPFVFAEINADTLYWKYQGERQPMKLLGRKTGGIGVNISTKALGKMRREDITHLYKQTEESSEERSVMLEALRRCENVFARYYLNEKFEDIKFDLQLKDDITIGHPFSVTVTVENRGDKDHEVSLVLRAETMLYTGVIKDLVKSHDSNLIIKPNSSKEVSLDITFEEYYKKLVDQCAFNISCLGKVKDTNFEYFAQDDFRIRKPDIDIKCNDDDIYVGKPSKWTASFKNPLPKALTKAKFYVLPSCADSCTKPIKKKVPANTDVSIDFEIVPKREGEMTVSLIFNSKELEDVDGVLTYEVKENLEIEEKEEKSDKEGKEEKPDNEEKEKADESEDDEKKDEVEKEED